MTRPMRVSVCVPSLSLPRVTRELRQRMAEQMFSQAVLDGPVALQCRVTVTKHRHGLFATKPPSLSELAHRLEHALIGIVFTGPIQIVRLSLSKAYGEKPGIEVIVERLAADDAQRAEDLMEASVDGA